MLVTLAAVLARPCRRGIGVVELAASAYCAVARYLCVVVNQPRRPLPEGLFYLPSLTSRSSASFACTTVQQRRCPPLPLLCMDC
jgi:hypothetical protein